MSEFELLYQKKTIFVKFDKFKGNINDLFPVPGEKYINEKLFALKDRLNESKSKLDDLYTNISDEEKRRIISLNKKTDLFSTLPGLLIAKANAQNISNAWLKYYELLRFFNVRFDHDPNVFFNAELPGASLCAWNHYAKTILKCSYNWKASSLQADIISNKKNNELKDLYGIYSHNKNNWLMDDTNDGDCTEINNIRDFENKVGEKSLFGGADLYSQDAGLDVTGNYNHQETMNSLLHLGAVLTGLLTLREGGIMISKHYTFFETFTWNLIMLISTMFEDFYLVKPLTSRPRNSEIYIFARGYKKNIDIINLLAIRLSEKNTIDPLINEKAARMIMTSQLTDILSFADDVFNQQIEFLDVSCVVWRKYNTNWLTVNELERLLKPYYEKQNNYWLVNYPIFRINNVDKVVDNKYVIKKRPIDKFYRRSSS